MASNNAVEIEIKANTSGAVSEISKLGESANAALLAADKLGLGFNTAMQKAQAGTEELNRSLGGIAGNQAAISAVISAQNKFIELGQAAGLTGDKIAEMHAKFGTQIGASAVTASIESARTQLMSMGVAAGLSASDLQKMGASIGMTAKETDAHTSQISASIARMAQQSGVSVGQINNAMRMVPMQFTDIATSLAGGMPPLTVLMQQGGQLKDSFGSASLAARGLAEYVIGLINPFTIAAGAVGVLALAYSQGSKETDAYRLALVNTGNAAGVTTGQLAGMAKHVSDSVGTTGSAAAALTALAATGRVAGEDMEKFATAALWAQKGLGVGVEETAKRFEELGKSPAEASAKLNESLNYLTASTYRQIRAAEEAGDKDGAAAIAQRAYADAIEERGKRVVASMGWIERAAMAAAGGAKSMWDAILDIGREEDPTAKAAAAAVKLLELRAKLQSGNYGATGNEQYDRAALESEIADQEKLVSGIQKKTAAENEEAKARAKNAALEQKRIEWDKGVDSGLSPEALALKKARKIREEGLAAGADMGEINARVGLVLQPLAAQGLQRQMEQLKEYQAQIVDGEKLTQAALAAEHSAGLLESVSYFQQKKQLALNANTDQQAVLELEIAATKRSGIAQAEKASKLAGLTAEMNKLERERVAIAQQAEIDIAAARRKAVQLNAANAIKDESEALEARYKLAMVKDADYYAAAAQNTAKYQQEKANLALETYLNETRYAVQGSQVEIDARQKMIKVVRDIGLERELAGRNALASAYEYGRTVDMALQRQAYESSLVLQTGEERTKLLAIYDIEAAKLEKIRQIMATTPEGEARDKSIADIEAAAVRAKQGEVSKSLNAEWKTHLDFVEGLTKGFWDDYPNGAAQAAQNALGKLKKQLFDELYKLMLKPLVLDVYANVTGQTGVASAFAGGGAGGGGLLNMATSAMGLPSLGAIGGSLSTGLQAGWAGTSLTGAVEAYTLAGETAIATTLGVGEAIGSFAAALGPVGLGIGAVALLAGSGMFGNNNAKVGGTYQYTQGSGVDVWRDEAGRTRLGTDGNEIGDNLIQKGIQATTDGINKLFEQLGSSTRVKELIGGAQSSSEKAELYREGYGTLSTGEKFGIQGEQKLGRTASPEEAIAEFSKAMNAATIDAIQKATDIPAAAKAAIAKINPESLSSEQFQAAVKVAIHDAQTTIAQEITGLDVSSFGDLMRGMADDGINAAQYMTDGMSASIQGAMAGKLQSDFNAALYDSVIVPMAATHTFSKAAAESIIADLQAKTAALKTLFSSDTFKAAMADMGSVLAEAQAPMRELNAYIPQTSGAVKSFADTASSASNSIADAAKKEADERKGLQDKLDALTMTRAELLAKEREEIGASNRALFDQLKAREAFNAANDLAKGELEKQASLAIDLMEARGDAEGALEARRGAAIRAATEGMNDANAELVAGAMRATSALEDQVNATSALRDVMASLGDKATDLNVKLLAGRGDEAGAKALSREIELSKLTAGKDAAAKKEIEAAFAKNAKLEDQIELEAKLSSAMRDVEKLQKANAMDAIKLQKDVAKEQADTAKALMEVVRSARLQLIGETDAGAKMQADAAREFIRNAAEAARKTGYLPDEKGVSEAIASIQNDQSDYASVADETYAKMLVAGDLAGLEDVSKSTLDKAEAAQKVAEAQLSALEGSNAVALQAAQAAQNDAARQLTELVGIREALGAQATIRANLDKDGVSGAAAKAQYQPAPVEFNEGLQKEGQALYGYLSDTLGTAGAVEAFAAQIKGYGYSLAEAEIILGAEKGSFEDAVKAFGIPAFAAGANIIPQDMLAMVHEGEAIIPAPFNPYLKGVVSQSTSTNPPSDNGEIIAELKELRAELTRVKDLLDRVTEGGNAMLTTTA